MYAFYIECLGGRNMVKYWGSLISLICINLYGSI